MPLEDKLPDNVPKNEDRLLHDYMDIINEYGIGSKEQKAFYDLTAKQYPVMKELFDTLHQLKDDFDKGLVPRRS